MNHAPANGYAANAAKRQWRHVAYQFSDWTAHGRRKSDRVVALLEHTEGCEVRHALSLGYRAENIHAFNRSAATLANMTRRLDRDGLPRVHTHARSIADVARVVGEVDVLSLDFTGPISEAAMIEINHAAAALRPLAVIMVNLQAAREHDSAGAHCVGVGRETVTITERLSEQTLRTIQLARNDVARLSTACLALSATDLTQPVSTLRCRWRPHLYRVGRYLNDARKPFLWFACTVVPCDGNATRERWNHIRSVVRNPAAVMQEFAKQTRAIGPFLCFCDTFTSDQLGREVGCNFFDPATVARARAPQQWRPL